MSDRDLNARILQQEFFERPTLQVARDLLGCLLCRGLPDGRQLRGRIVEVEAYDGPQDKASHACRGLTARNAPMFEMGGIAYVYLIYGMHNCMNVVTGSKGYPAAVLLRAAEPPLDGLSASGPGRLTRAFQIDRALDSVSLLGEQIWLERAGGIPDFSVKRTPRIGVDYAGAWAGRNYRFIVVGHPEISGPKRLG